MQETILKDVLTWLAEVMANFGLKLIVATAILIIGRFIIKYVSKLIVKIMVNRQVDAAITTFTHSLIKGTMWLIVLIIALSQMGIQTTSFIAVLGAAGLAMGLAFQGSLANFAAGVLIILFRPFKVGDAVEAGGVTGVVKAISLFTTDFMSFDNKKIIVPNSQIMNTIITNITGEERRRVDLTFCVGFTNDVETIKELIKYVISKHPLVLRDVEPTVRLSSIGKDSLDFVVRVWCNTTDYWTVYFDITEAVKESFDKHNVVKPFAHYVVHSS